MSGVRIREAVSALAGYKPGPKAPGAIVLASNETPFDALPAVLKAVQDVDAFGRYPDATAFELTAAIAARHRVDVDRVVTGCGSIALCQQLVQATVDPGDEVVFSWPSFEAYPQFVAVAGGRAVTVPLVDEYQSLPAMLAAITPATRLVFVCNPNNPTSTGVDGAQLEWFLDSVPADCLVVIDEAYREYVTTPGAIDGIDAARGRDNVVVLRTFSKAFGLAALRVGYAVGAPAVIAALAKVAVPFAVSSLAQRAALAVLDEEPEILRRAALTVTERERVISALRAQGWNPPDSSTNFVWLPLRDRAETFGRSLAEQGVLVRTFPGVGSRITIGTPEENDRLLQLTEGLV